MVRGITLVDDRAFRWQNRATARDNTNPALAAGTTAAAGGRDEQVGISQSLHQFGADRNGKFQLVVYGDLDVPNCDQPGACDEDDKDQNQHDGREQADAQQHLLQHGRVYVHFRFPRSP